MTPSQFAQHKRNIVTFATPPSANAKRITIISAPVTIANATPAGATLGDAVRALLGGSRWR
jgi:hypothetical protein